MPVFILKQLHDNRINRRHYENPIVSPIIEISDSCQTALFFSALHKGMGDHASIGSPPPRRGFCRHDTIRVERKRLTIRQFDILRVYKTMTLKTTNPL